MTNEAKIILDHIESIENGYFLYEVDNYCVPEDVLEAMKTVKHEQQSGGSGLANNLERFICNILYI